MSLTREVIQESKDYLRENCAQLFGQKFWECRLAAACQLSTKSDKFESRFIVISKFRLFLMHGKNATSFKLERSFNLLALRVLIVNEKEVGGNEHRIQVIIQLQLSITYEDKPKSTAKFTYRSDDVPPMEMARELLAALKHYWPDIGPCLPKFVQIQPESLLVDFQSLPNSQPYLPCHNFRRSYVAFCDYVDHPFKEEVFWDIERIYFSHHIREIRLDDFSHLNVKDHIAVLGCVQFSSYFTGIFVDGIRLLPEHIEVILSVVRRSTSLKSLKLMNCGLLKDFTQHLGAALQSNLSLPLAVLDLSGNILEDKKAISHLSNILPKVTSLKSISFADCGLTEKSIHHLAAGLNTGLTLDTNISGRRFELKRLVLSRCSLKDEANELVNFVSVCGSLRCLDLSGTGMHIDRLWTALKFGGLQLEQLNLSGCQTSKKIKESASLVKELFACMVNLEELNLAGTQLTPDVLRGILTGLSNNAQLSNIRLNLDGVCGDRGCCSALELLPNCPIAFLSLRDNALEQDAQKLLSLLRDMKSLQSLDIGGSNFAGLRANKKVGASLLTKMMNELVKLVSVENSNLKELILSDARLGSFLSVLFSALGVATIEQLDINNNEIGNFGCKLMSKALQLNTSIRCLAFDRNQITADGFVEVAHALRLNHTITSIPYPIVDIAEALARPDRSRVLTAVADIERALEKNRTEPLYRERFSQKMMQDLNNHCDVYEVDSSSHKKIVFHNLMTILAELPNDSALSVSTHGLVENFLSNLLVLTRDNDQHFLSLLHKKLTEHNVEIMDSNFERQTDRPLESNLRTKVREMIESFLTESAYQNATAQLDRLLTKSDGLKLRGTFSSSNIDNSMLAGQFTSRTNNQVVQTHRPNSTLFAEDSPVRNGTSNGTESNGLVHLVKERPPPPRKRAQNQSTPTHTNGTSDSVMTSSAHSTTTSSSGEPIAPSRTSTPRQTTGDEPPELPNTTPPPLAPRRAIRQPTPTHPPRLPPKPGQESPSSTRSPTDLRNHFVKVLPGPALDIAREMFKDDDSP
ncbi:Carm-PH domain-containing protein [Aphelenchoides besseyi]|nr:Carm-PH domain-containing protein [Aphelenchoides besseyi]KAI6208461.1 Carm-PH domain-containing protein [Aphelenchoides besseyi]